MKNSQYKLKDVKKRCENKLEIDFRDAKEFNGWFIYKDTKIARITIPKNKSKKGIPTGTYKSMAKQLKITIEQFDDLLECPFKLKHYLEHLDATNVINLDTDE